MKNTKTLFYLCFLTLIIIIGCQSESFNLIDENKDDGDLPSENFISSDKFDIKLNIDPCKNINEGQIQFEYLDSIYIKDSAEINLAIDTIYGTNYGLPITELFFKKRISIRTSISETKSIKITINDIENPNSLCFTETKYDEFNETETESFCYAPNPDSFYELCNVSQISKQINSNDGSLQIFFASHGYLEVTKCENGYLSAYFSNDFYKNGRICNLKIE